MSHIERIYRVICCPKCKKDVQIIPKESTDYGVKTGTIYCGFCHRHVASIYDYKIDFIRPKPKSSTVDFPVRKDRVQGNDFPARFRELIQNVPENGIILDFGGGPRQMSDPRYINFEYSLYDEVDVFGDGHQLPFKDNSFDLILSQAVTEHVYNPFQVAKENFRILKPGGRIYVESAFMQPLHGVPYHYFNTTLWGLEELFKDFQKVSSGWFGNFTDLIGWMLQSTGIESKVGKDKIDAVMSLFREFDQVATHADIQPIAVGVYFEGVKEV